MQKEVNFKSLPKEYTSNYIDEGKNGECFLIDGNRVFKRLYNPNNFIDCIERLSKIKVDTFVFPEQLVYVNNNFVGYTMEYVDGTKLKYLEGAPLKEYLKEIIKCEYSLVSLSNKKIFMLDFTPSNVMFSKDNKIKAIDTDFYNKTSRKNVYQMNLDTFSSTILTPFMDIFDTNFNNRKLNVKKELLLEGKYLPSKFILEVLKELRKEINCELNNTSDVKASLKYIRK